MEKFRHFIAGLGQELCLPGLQPDKNGLISLSIDKDSILNIQFLPAADRALIFLPVADISHQSSAALRQLMTANLFGRGTGGGWFGLEEESGTLVYHYLVDLREPPPLEKFIQLLEQILKLCEQWRRKCLRSLNYADRKSGTARPLSGRF